MKSQYIEATFVKKYNRFLCQVSIEGEYHDAHIPNTGRLKELLYEGNRIAVKYVGHLNRKTAYELSLAMKDGYWYSVDSRVPNQLVKEWAVEEKHVLFKKSALKAEKTFGNSRFDFQIEGALNGFIEVKGVTLEMNGTGYFPDAPTERGKKHLRELIEVKKQGKFAGVIFVCQCEAIKSFKPNAQTDPEFAKLLSVLKYEGVYLLALGAKVSLEGIEYNGELEIILD